MKPFEERHAEAQATYQAGRERVRATPPPEGQKFAPGTRVRIVGDYWPGPRTGQAATVLYTHAHAYGGDNAKSYCIDIDGQGAVAWFEEGQLEPL